MPIQCDYHMHTPLCQHAAGPMEAYVERAIELGLREVGFSDHNPLPNGFGANVRMKESELEYYVQRVTDLQFQYRGKIDVMLGLELDYIEGLEDYLARQIAAYPWDYILGSVHYLDRECRVGSWSKNYPGGIDEHYTRYFALVRQLAQSGLCDIIAHLDVVKRNAQVPTPRGLDQVTATLQTIAQAGLAVEINTSGYRHSELVDGPQPYPALPFVREALALDIPLTVNSDAHAPEQVGTKFGEIEGFLKKSGCQHLARFNRRQRELYAL
jgi:histidinol-phosphatase (PHP family)